MTESNEHLAFEQAVDEVVELGNRLVEENEDVLDVADGLLHGAVHFWLYSRRPCGNPRCEDCAMYNTSDKRLRLLLEMVRNSACSSEYFHTPEDADAGNA